MTPHRDLATALANELTKLLALTTAPTTPVLVDVLDMTRAFAMEPTRAALGGSTHGVQTVQWCFDHQATHPEGHPCQHSVLVPVHSDPTGNGATSPAPDRDVSYLLLLSAVETITDEARELSRQLIARRRLTTSQARRLFLDVTGTSANRAVKCAMVLCEDMADTVGEIYCQPCRDWLAKHPEARQVPRAVIQERTKKRKKRADLSPT